MIVEVGLRETVNVDGRKDGGLSFRERWWMKNLEIEGVRTLKMPGSSGERRGVLWQHLCPGICFSGAALVIGSSPRDGNHVPTFRGW